MTDETGPREVVLEDRLRQVLHSEADAVTFAVLRPVSHTLAPPPHRWRALVTVGVAAAAVVAAVAVPLAVQQKDRPPASRVQPAAQPPGDPSVEDFYAAAADPGVFSALTGETVPTGHVVVRLQTTCDDQTPDSCFPSGQVELYRPNGFVGVARDGVGVCVRAADDASDATCVRGNPVFLTNESAAPTDPQQQPGR